MRLITNEQLDEYCYRNRVIPPLIRRQLYAPASLTGFQQATPTTFRDIGNKAPAFEIKYAQEFFEPEKVRENVGLQVYNALSMLPKNEVLSRDRAASIITGAINYQIGLIRATRTNPRPATRTTLHQRAAETITRELGRVIARRRKMVNQQVQAVSQLSGKVDIDEAITNVITRAQTGVAVEKLIADFIARSAELTPEGRARGIKIFKEASEAGKLRLEMLDNVAREESRAALDTIINQLEAEEDVVNRLLDEVFIFTEPGVDNPWDIYVEAIAEEAGSMGLQEEKQEEPKFRIAVNPQDEIDELEEEIQKQLGYKRDNAKSMIRLDNDITRVQRKIENIRKDLVRKGPERRPRFQEQLEREEDKLRVLEQHMANLKGHDTIFSSEIETNREMIEQFREDLKEI